MSACYFYGFKDTDSVSTIELVEIYDLIIDTITLFDIHTEELRLPDIDYKDIFDCCHNLKEFQSATNPISPLFQIRAIAYLRQVIETCQKLLPINRLTIKKYFQLKYQNKEMDTKEIFENHQQHQRLQLEAVIKFNSPLPEEFYFQ